MVTASKGSGYTRLSYYCIFMSLEYNLTKLELVVNFNKYLYHSTSISLLEVLLYSILQDASTLPMHYYLMLSTIFYTHNILVGCFNRQHKKPLVSMVHSMLAC